MINPCIIGRIPAFFILENEVLRPIAARAQTIRNLLNDFVVLTTLAGIGTMLATTDWNCQDMCSRKIP